MEPLQKVSIAEKLASFDAKWQPKIVATVDAFAVKVVKLDGPFVWHVHEHNDEMFYVVRGGMTMQYRRDGVEDEVRFGPGELLTVPRGVEHCPVADPDTEIVLFEPADLVNTGDLVNDRTAIVERI